MQRRNIGMGLFLIMLFVLCVTASWGNSYMAYAALGILGKAIK